MYHKCAGPGSKQKQREREGGIEKQSTHAGAIGAYFSVDEEAVVGAEEGVVVVPVAVPPHKLEHSGFVLVMDQRPAQHR